MILLIKILILLMIHFEETYFGENCSKPTQSSKKKIVKKVIKKKENKK